MHIVKLVLVINYVGGEDKRFTSPPAPDFSCILKKISKKSLFIFSRKFCARTLKQKDTTIAEGGVEKNGHCI